MGNTSSSLQQEESSTVVRSARKISSPFQFRDLVSKYEKHFPLLFTISSFAKSSSRRNMTSLKQGEYFYAYFHKESEIVKIEIENGAKYSVPLRSSLQCSCLYNPDNLKVTDALSGYTFSGVAEIMDSNPMPQMVYATQGYLSPSGNECACIDEGQVLQLLNVDTDSRGNRALSCIDVKSYEKKLLEADCNVQFTTNTSFLRLQLESLIEYVSLPTPVVFFAPTEILNECFPKEIPCVITDKSVSTSVIVSPYTQSSIFPNCNSLVEILPDAPIDVCVASLSEDEKQLLSKTTLSLLSTFSPSFLVEVVGDLKTPIDTKLQTDLFKCIDQDIYWSREFINPQEMTVLKGNFSTTAVDDGALDINGSYDDHDVYDDVNGDAAYVDHDVYDDVHVHDDDAHSEDYETMQLYNNNLIKCTTDTVSIPSIPLGKDSLQVTNAKTPTANVYVEQADLQVHACNSNIKNRQLLKKYTVIQVLDLLEKLNLSEYKESFKKEQITGSLLLELDNEILEQELGIQKKLHRIRLLKVIEGHHSLP